MKDRCLIRWRLLLNGLRSVLVNAIDKPLKLKFSFVSTRDLVPSDRATCIIASRANFFITNLSLRTRIWCFSFDRFFLYLQACTHVINTPVCKRFSCYDAIEPIPYELTNGKFHRCFTFISIKTLQISYSFQSAASVQNTSDGADESLPPAFMVLPSVIAS